TNLGEKIRLFERENTQLHSSFFPDEPDTLRGRTRSFEVTIERGLARIDSGVSKIHQD
ncbi:hypothetical protein LINPERHAP1_LOCUS32711, partial [Linum perenne]